MSMVMTAITLVSVDCNANYSLANKILYLMYNLKETGRRVEFSDGNESEGFMKATNLSDQEVQDTTQDHDASTNLITK